MTLVKFYKNPCGGCILVGNLLNGLGVKYIDVNVFDDKDTNEKLDMDSEQVRKNLNISSVPVVILFDEVGGEIDRVNGYNPPAIEALLEKMD